MAIDRYYPCPCGSGKKIKFCCCKDLLSELEKIERMLSGEQRTAALEYVNSLLKKYPDREALLCTKAMLETQLNHPEDAEKTIAHLVETHPTNAVGHAERAFAAGIKGDYAAAVDALQDALKNLPDDQMASRVYEAIGLVGEALLRAGQIYPARAHLLLQAGIGGSEDTRALSLLMRLNRAAEVPLLLKDDPDFVEPSEGVAWADAADVAMKQAARGYWREGAASFRKITDEHPQAADAWRNLATLEALLAHPQQAVAALRTYSQLDIPNDDAVEAIALAKLLDAEADEPEVDVLEWTVDVKEIDPLIERFASDKRMSKINFDPAAFPNEDGPPPRLALRLLDNPLPVGSAELTRAEIPNIVGELLLYGRRTDREARVQMQVIGSERLETARALLQEIAGELLDLPGEEEAISKLPAAELALSWNWRMPEDTPRETRTKLIDEQRRDVILNKWTAVAVPELEGKTPTEAAGDAKLSLELQALVLLLELSTTQAGQRFDFGELRDQLKLPHLESIDPTESKIEQLSLPRLARLQVEKLTDEQLIACYQRAATTMTVVALRNLAAELIGRESIDDAEGKADACALLAQIEDDSSLSMQWLHRAKEFATTAGKSPAEYMLAELGLRISRGEIKEAEGLLQQLQANHINEPGVAQGIYSMLSQLGLIQPGQMPGAGAMPPGVQPAAATAAAPAAAGAGKVWTPGGEQPATDKPSKLWTPDD